MKALSEVNLKENDRRAILQAANILRAQFPVEKVILFGSKARGDDDAESDIDLLVLTSLELPWQERDRLIDSVFDLQLEHDVVISLFVAPLGEWEHGLHRFLPIHDEISREGIAA